MGNAKSKHESCHHETPLDELKIALSLLKSMPMKATEVMSPANLILALTLLEQGTNGETKKKLLDVLAPNKDEKQLLADKVHLQRALQVSQKGLLIQIVNRMFVDKHIKIKKDYKDAIKEHFEAGVTKMNFRKTGRTAKKISEFVRKATKGTIESGIDEAAIQGATAVMISTLYCKAAWQSDFLVKLTKMDAFTKADGNTVEILFMNTKESCRYYSDDTVSILCRSFLDGWPDFVWILPKNPSGKAFEEFKKNLDAEKLKELLQKMECKEIKVKIPKMDIKCSFELAPIFKKLGLHDLLATSSDYTRVTDSAFQFNGGRHETMLEMDEVEIVAAAVTIPILISGCRVDVIPPPPPEFFATHPFIFLMHKQDHPIMIGQFNGPQKD